MADIRSSKYRQNIVYIGVRGYRQDIVYKHSVMRAVLTNLGSIGDVQPLVALAAELQRHRHQPVLALLPHFASLVKPLGFPFVPIGRDLDYRTIQRKQTEALTRGVDPVALMRDLLGWLPSMLPEMLCQLQGACRDADVLISGQIQPVARIVHELTGIPLVSIQINPLATRKGPIKAQAVAAAINPFRAQLRLPPLDDPINSMNGAQLVLYPVSRHVFPPSPDWPMHFHMTGYFFLDDEQWPLDLGLVEFLTADERPVVVSFSSVVHQDPPVVTQLVVEAIRHVGCRAIIQRGWSGLAAGELPPNIYAAGFIPHTWLFPRASCVVHHGGMGTAAAALRAGIPAVFVPQVLDGYLWAELTRELGCTGPAIPYPELTAERLAAAIAETLHNAHYSQSAATLAEKIRKEPGVTNGRRLIEQLVYKTGLHQDKREPTPQGIDPARQQEARLARRKEYQQKQRALRRA